MTVSKPTGHREYQAEQGASQFLALHAKPALVRGGCERRDLCTGLAHLFHDLFASQDGVVERDRHHAADERGGGPPDTGDRLGLAFEVQGARLAGAAVQAHQAFLQLCAIGNQAPRNLAHRLGANDVRIVVDGQPVALRVNDGTHNPPRNLGLFRLA